MAQRKKKTIEYHFVNMNDPNRYKKLKVARACDFCRRRKSKCDIGIPGSGTCSNCKKANHICIFSPVSATSTTTGTTATTATATTTTVGKSPVPMTTKSPSIMNRQHIQEQQQQQQLSYDDNASSFNKINNFANLYQDKFPFFSMDQKAHCGYERGNIYAHMTLASTASMAEDNIPVYSKQMEHELFDAYFSYVHPFFPILDRYYILQSLRFDSDSISCSLKWAVMAIVLAHFSHRHQDSNKIASLYHQHALNQLDHSPCLSTVQTLFLLYKYQEMVTPVGTPISTSAIGYLKEAQSILSQLQKTQQQHQQQQQPQQPWTVNDEFICRAGWITFIVLAMSNTADERWRSMLEYCVTPTRLPSLTETEQYDKNELNTTCNLIHLINIALLYSQTICLISDQSTLFSGNDRHVADFNKLSTGLEVWTNTLPSHITLSLSADPPSLYSAHQQGHNVTQHDGSKSGSFTAYLCLIYDILHLLISIHQPSQQHDLSRKALAICFRAHSFTIGDMQPPQFSRLASIQGSRLVSFGLTLALQTQSFYHQQQQQPQQQSSLESIKKFYSCCSLSFQIFDQVCLSPQLYMTIQTFRNQIESQKQLEQQQQQQHEQVLEKQNYNNISHYHNSNSNSSSSLQSIHGGLDSSSSSSSNQSQTSSTPAAVSMDSSYYYGNNNSSNLSQPQQGRGGREGGGGEGGWQQYTTSYTTTSYSYSNDSYYPPSQQQQQEDIYNMPITPTFHENNIPLYDTSPIIADSYFQPYQEQRYSSGVMMVGPYEFINQQPFELYNSTKSCKNKKKN